MKNSYGMKPIIALACVAFGGVVHAETFNFLVNEPYFQGLTNGDDFWGNADYATPGFNIHGAASSSVTNFGFYAYWSAGHFTAASDFAVPGTKAVTAYDIGGEVYWTPLGHPNLINAPAFYALDQTHVSTITTHADQTFDESIFLTDNNEMEGVGGYFLVHGQDPGAVFSDPQVIGHFNAILPALPDNWAVATFGRTVTLDPGTREPTSRNSFTAYSTVPLPGSGWLLGLSLGALQWVRRRS